MLIIQEKNLLITKFHTTNSDFFCVLYNFVIKRFYCSYNNVSNHLRIMPLCAIEIIIQIYNSIEVYPIGLKKK